MPEVLSKIARSRIPEDKQRVITYKDWNGVEQELTVITCPFCSAEVGIDSTYLDQVEDTVTCPCCREEITVMDSVDRLTEYDVWYEKTVTLKTKIKASSPENAYEKFNKIRDKGLTKLEIEDPHASTIEKIKDNDYVLVELGNLAWGLEDLEH